MPATMNRSFVISSEAIAWAALERLVDGDEDIGPIEFDGWPSVDLKIQGDRYSATVPSRLMRHVSDIQFAMNRCYGRAVYNGDGRSIKHHERDDLELLYEIREGSTELRADATGFLNKLGEALSKPSTKNTAAITACILALLLAGGVVISNLSDHKKEIEIKRLELLGRAIDKAPELKDASPEFQRIYREIVGAASDADKITIGGRKISTDQIASIAATQPNVGQRVDLSGDFKVTSVRRYKGHCLVDITLPDGGTIRARVAFDRFADAEVAALSLSVARNSPLGLSITALKHPGGYSNGRVTQIRA